MNGRQFKFENAMASMAGTPLRGKFDLDLAAAPRVTGPLNADTIDAAAILGGIPACRPRGDASWPAEPFASGWLGGVSGRVAVSAAQANIAITM